LIERGFLCNQKKSPKQKRRKKENAKGGKKGVEKKSLLNAAEIGEPIWCNCHIREYGKTLR